jgi:hypothetical protein
MTARDPIKAEAMKMAQTRARLMQKLAMRPLNA